MRRERKLLPHFIAIIAIVLFVALGLGSTCSSTAPAAATETIKETEGYAYPVTGMNNVSITGKDFTTVGIIFVNSEEVVDNFGNRSGSKITYEMFMREAAELKADDVINIKIDVNRKTEKVKVKDKTVIISTYKYTGMGLAIKYANYIPVISENNANELR